MSQSKILLVEDDPFMVRLYQRVLSAEHFVVEVADNGREGYEKTKTFKPDLVLLDVMMPVMNGLQALEKIKTDPATKGVTVFMLSNLANKPDAEAALKIGASRYLIKSDYEPTQVIEIINEFFTQYRSANKA